MEYRRRRSYEKRKPISPVSMMSMACGIVALIVEAACLNFSAANQGNSNNFSTAVGVLAMVVAFVAFVKALPERTNEAFDIVTRWAGIAISGVAAFAWFAIYLLGAIVG